MISTRKIFAICEKDFKGLARNLFVLSGILIVPIIAFVMGLVIEPEYAAQASVTFIVMNIMMNGANIICVMIAEEKEKHTLNVLSASTVSGLDFLISKLLIAVVLTAVVNVIIYFMFGLLDVMPIGSFMLITSIAILPAAAIGAVIGIATKTQSAASTAVAPIALIPIFLPMVIPAESAAWNVLRFLFTEQVVSGLRAIYLGESFISSIGIIVANFAVLFIVFLVYYRKKGLSG
ncbi:MAG: ABC transporter permease [Defluviitaleaceae bacterium]|nr:ABC transporter permease [Defluviitaleaceae bacterium]